MEEIARNVGRVGGVVGVQVMEGLEDRGRNVKLGHVIFQEDDVAVVEHGQLSGSEAIFSLVRGGEVKPKLEIEE